MSKKKEPAHLLRIFTRSKGAHTLKRFWQRIRIYAIRKTDPRIQDWNGLTDEEKRISSVIRRLIKKPDSELLLSPMSSRYFVKNERGQILVIFRDGEASVINHVYGYNVKISPRTFKSLYSIFVTEVEIRRDRMEEEYRKNMKSSLESIISTMED